ncbi:glucose-6-phosphate dehydrogenase assembly protein OpcA [Bifidobacterium eulemuris]|uniref:Glucose-6-phosphate dehydrogenase assembly protein OpcA n=1 Tax=Bifidobacterium eulemuris TaxID=1765219 RepID=A0A261G9T6_9BIFI|nr:glucose-6-phosphate dehydrogenase assembly protein OpcA [Bifidobacterium eulemuris]OZG68192.1 OpcA protein [Bifidobacterium eulemuris]QOL31751.1 glucose-6-phosphate dehydrogenase assembly protein OpcA [Bifidobacterium eulemuris]
MIIELNNTRTREIAAKIDELHEERGEAALGRVLTLLIATDEGELEHALELANNASREHPCRVIAVVPHAGKARAAAKPEPEAVADGRAAQGGRTGKTQVFVDTQGGMAVDAASESGRSNLDAEIRFGADAGAGEIIVLRPRGGLVHHPDTLVIPLLVPDAPVVAWWPTEAPANPKTDLLGAMARRRITDAKRSSNPARTIEDLRRNWSSQNIDMSWTRLTVWRAMIATMLDQPPHLPIISAKVSGPKDFISMTMLAAWLRLKLGVSVTIEDVPGSDAVTGVYLTRADGVLSLERPSVEEGVATISTPGQAPQTISVPARTLEECLSEELRRLDPDEVYAEVLTRGWDLIHPQR